MLEIRRARPEHAEALGRFLQAIDSPEERRFFSPHPFDMETASRLCDYEGQDLYYLLLLHGDVIGYGFLRGWDEGFAVPSVGVCIAPGHRRKGLGRCMMVFLHTVARNRESRSIRLKVHKGNIAALKMYKSLGYELESQEGDFRIGFLDMNAYLGPS